MSPSFRIHKSFGEITKTKNGGSTKNSYSTVGNSFAFNIVGHVSAGIEFIANEHFRFRLNPTFKIQMTPEKQQYIKKNYWSTTFDVSVFYYF